MAKLKKRKLTEGDIWLRDEDIHRLGYIFLDHGKHWTRPDSLGEEYDIHGEVKNGL